MKLFFFNKKAIQQYFKQPLYAKHCLVLGQESADGTGLFLMTLDNKYSDKQCSGSHPETLPINSNMAAVALKTTLGQCVTSGPT